MRRKSSEIEGYTPEQIKALINKDGNYKVGMRLFMVYLVSLGKSLKELEAMFGLSYKQILNWKVRFEKEGVEGLHDKPGSGRKGQLEEHQMKRIYTLVTTESPLEYGMKAEAWTRSLLIKWIKQEFGIEFKHAQIYNILKKLGLSFRVKSDPLQD
jgi:transposase